MPDIDFEPWERFSEWIHSICVVTFDLEIGQALEVGFFIFFFNSKIKYLKRKTL